MQSVRKQIAITSTVAIMIAIIAIVTLRGKADAVTLYEKINVVSHYNDRKQEHPKSVTSKLPSIEKLRSGDDVVAHIAKNLNSELVRTKDSWSKETTDRVWNQIRQFIIVDEWHKYIMESGRDPSWSGGAESRLREMTSRVTDPRNVTSTVCGKMECEVRIRIGYAESEADKRAFMQKLADIGQGSESDRPFSVKQIFHSNDDTSLGFGYEAYYTRWK